MDFARIEYLRARERLVDFFENVRADFCKIFLQNRNLLPCDGNLFLCYEVVCLTKFFFYLENKTIFCFVLILTFAIFA